MPLTKEVKNVQKEMFYVNALQKTGIEYIELEGKVETHYSSAPSVYSVDDSHMIDDFRPSI